MDDISVRDFAAQIMRAEETGAQPSPPTLNPIQSNYSPNVLDQVDISQVEVPHNFVESIVEANEIEVPSTVSPIEEEKREPVKESNPVDNNALGISVEGLAQILSDIQVTLNEVKVLLHEQSFSTNELTAVGALGVNMAPKKKKPKKDDRVQRILAQLKKRKATR